MKRHLKIWLAGETLIAIWMILRWLRRIYHGNLFQGEHTAWAAFLYENQYGPNKDGRYDLDHWREAEGKPTRGPAAHEIDP